MQSPEPAPAPSRRKRRASGVVVPHEARWYQRCAATLIALLVRTVSATLRYHWDDRSDFFDAPVAIPAIYCVWHNRLALSMAAYYKYAFKHNRTKGMAAMVSASKDGAFLAAILESFRVQPVRGSSSRRGAQALLELTTWAEQGFDLAITPDGPRGPCYKVQDGVMSLAQVTGMPIIPVSYHVNWSIRARSWDSFCIPLPFSRCSMNFGKSVRVPRDATDEDRERLRLELERILREITVD